MSSPLTDDPVRETNAPTRAGGSLSFRLTALVLLTMWLGMAVSVAVDYRREYVTHTEDVFLFLRQQAYSLELIREHVPDTQRFAHYVDAICRRMNETIAPGHHILVVGPNGELIANTTSHSGPEVEKALLAADPHARVLVVENHHLALFRLQGRDGWTIITAEYLDHVFGILRAQLLSRVLNAAIVALALTILIFLLMHSWVLRPVSALVHAARAWARRDFAARTPVLGPSDMRMLATEFNSMADKLQTYQDQQTSELVRARQIQRNLLPESVPSAPGVSVAAVYRPANHVAGDLDDFFPLSHDRFAVFVLDVSGYGLSAALMTGVMKMALHRRLAESDDLPAAMDRVNSDETIAD